MASRPAKKSNSFLAADISSRHVCKSEIDAVTLTCEKLRQTVNTLDEELHCQNIFLTFTQLSLQTSLATRSSVSKTADIIKEKFRAIKHLPVELWLAIMSAVVQAANEEWEVTEKDYDLLYPALRLAQVCGSWRRIILDTPRLWMTISCGSTKEKNQKKRANLMALLVTRARGLRLNIVDRTHSDYSPSQWGCWWPLRPGSVETMLSAYNYHIRLWNRYWSKGVESNSWPSPLKAVFEAHSVGTETYISTEMVEHLKDVPDLTLINIPLGPPRSVVSETLTRLKIEFNSGFIDHRGNVPKCWIHSLLSRSLQTLEISQYASGMITWKGPIFQLPNLRSLAITPHEHDLLRFLDIPSLSILKISYPPGKLTLSLDKCIASFTTICVNVKTLTLNWKKGGTPKTISLFTALWDYTPKLQTMTFSNAKLNGKDLCDALERRAEGGKRLTNLVIDGCVGISRTECERLVSMIDRLSVSNTIHLAK